MVCWRRIPGFACAWCHGVPGFPSKEEESLRKVSPRDFFSLTAGAERRRPLGLGCEANLAVLVAWRRQRPLHVATPYRSKT